jgi:hypothetical protein
LDTNHFIRIITDRGELGVSETQEKVLKKWQEKENEQAEQPERNKKITIQGISPPESQLHS